MALENDVFILGAGASHDYGFPTGAELIEKIIEILPEDDREDLTETDSVFIWLALVQLCEDKKINASKDQIQKHMVQFRNLLFISQPKSIDEFLSRKNIIENEFFHYIGKISICFLIANAENEAKSESGDMYNSGWYNYLWNNYIYPKYLDGSLKDIRFIIFNYDRSFEYYLTRKFSSLNYNKDAHDTLSFDPDDKDNWSLNGIPDLEKVHIIHPYGKLGDLSENVFGNADFRSELIQLSEKIFVINEKERQSEDLFNESKKAIENSCKILFLGFGFDPTNMDRLGCGQGIPSTSNGVNRIVFPTLYKTYDSERRRIIRKYFNSFGDKTPNYIGASVNAQHDIIEYFKYYSCFE